MVYLVGSFNNWLGATNGKIRETKSNEKWKMEKGNAGGGRWSLPVKLMPGNHQFRFYVKWDKDSNIQWSNPGISQYEKNGENSLVNITSRRE